MTGCCEHCSEPWGCIKLGEFSTVWGTISFSRTALHHGTSLIQLATREWKCKTLVTILAAHLGIPSTHHWHAIGTAQANTWHTIGTPSTRHRYTIGTTSEHHSHKTGTHLAHHWHILGTLLAHHWYTPGPTAGLVAVTIKTTFCLPLNDWAMLDESGPGSSVGISTNYGLGGPGSNPGGDEIFRPSRPILGPTQPPVKWVSGLSRW